MSIIAQRKGFHSSHASVPLLLGSFYNASLPSSFISFAAGTIATQQMVHYNSAKLPFVPLSACNPTSPHVHAAPLHNMVPCFFTDGRVKITRVSISPLATLQISPTAIRGVIGTINQLVICMGILLALLINVAFPPTMWRTVFLLAAVPAVLLLVGTLLPGFPRVFLPWVSSCCSLVWAYCNTCHPAFIGAVFQAMRAAFRFICVALKCILPDI